MTSDGQRFIRSSSNLRRHSSLCFRFVNPDRPRRVARGYNLGDLIGDRLGAPSRRAVVGVAVRQPGPPSLRCCARRRHPPAWRATRVSGISGNQRSSRAIRAHQKVISAHHAPAWRLGVLAIAYYGRLLQAAGTSSSPLSVADEGGHQGSSGAIRGHQLLMREVISMAISGHQRAHLQQAHHRYCATCLSAPATANGAERATAGVLHQRGGGPGEQQARCNLECALAEERGAPHLISRFLCHLSESGGCMCLVKRPPDEGGNQRSSERPSEVIRGHQKQ